MKLTILAKEPTASEERKRGTLVTEVIEKGRVFNDCYWHIRSCNMYSSSKSVGDCLINIGLQPNLRVLSGVRHSEVAAIEYCPE